MTEEKPEVSVNEVIEILMERIASLELEVAILKSMLLPKRTPEPPIGEAPGNPGSYL